MVTSFPNSQEATCWGMAAVRSSQKQRGGKMPMNSPQGSSGQNLISVLEVVIFLIFCWITFSLVQEGISLALWVDSVLPGLRLW